MIKLLFKYAMYGIAVGCFYIVAGLIIVDLFWPDALYTFMQQNFTLSVLSGLVISALSSAGAIIYTFEHINFILQLSIHTITVLTAALAIGFWQGWFFIGSPVSIAAWAGIWLLIFFATWLCFYLWGNHEVNKINKKIKERDSES